MRSARSGAVKIEAAMLTVPVDRDEKQLILDANPDVYFSSPHYDGWPGVQIPTRAHRARRASRTARRRLADPGAQAPRHEVPRR